MKQLLLAVNIAEHRHQCKITQDELAEFLGVTKASVSKWENGQSYPDITLLPKLASYFNISIDQLMGYQAQMPKEKIKECYHQLASDFANLPFEQVMTKTNELVREYYSCYPLLLQIVILWVNHLNMTHDEGRQKKILQDIVNLCNRIISESEQTILTGDAAVLKAIAQLQLKETQDAIHSLEELLDPKRLTRQSDGLLIQAYLMNGEAEKAETTTQISMLMHLAGILSTGSQYLSMHLQNPELAEKIIQRLERLIQIFEADKLQSNTALSIYYQAAVFYCLQQRKSEALEELKKFASCSTYMIKHGVMLHGDSFFSKVDQWYNELALGAAPVRNEKLIIADILKIFENPALSILFEMEEYQLLKKQMQINFRR